MSTNYDSVYIVSNLGFKFNIVIHRRTKYHNKKSPKNLIVFRHMALDSSRKDTGLNVISGPGMSISLSTNVVAYPMVSSSTFFSFLQMIPL